MAMTEATLARFYAQAYAQMEEQGREALLLYGIDPTGMTREEVFDHLEAEGECDVESVICAVLGGADYPVRLPGMPSGAQLLPPAGTPTGVAPPAHMADLVRAMGR